MALHTDDTKIFGKATAVKGMIGMLSSFIQSYRYVMLMIFIPLTTPKFIP